MEKQEKLTQPLIPRRKHLNHVLRLSMSFWFLLGLIVSSIGASLAEDNRFTLFFACVFLSILIATLFGGIFGLVLNRFMLVAYSKPGDKEVPFSWAARIGKKFRIWFEILLFGLFIFSLLAVIAVPTHHPPNYAGAAIASVKTIASAQEQYRGMYDKYGTFEELLAENIIKEDLTSGQKHKYKFSLVADVNKWICTAIPVKRKSKTQRAFFCDESGVIRFTADGTIPDANSQPIDY